MNRRLVLNIISKIVMIEGLLLLLPMIVGFIYKEKEAYLFLIISVITLLSTYLISKIKVYDRKFYTKEGLVIVSCIWIIWSLIGALPFYISNSIPNYIDAFFETVSGFTTTGSTIINDIEVLSKSILFWRSFTHWIGGMGVLVFVLAVIPLSENGTMHLLRAEVPGPSVSKLVPKAKKTALILYGIYFLLTVIQTILLIFGKMNFYEALLHSFSTAGTGGFSTRNASVAAFNSAYIEYVIAIFMILFGVNFNIYFYLLIRDIKSIFKNEELKYYFGTIIAVLMLLCFNIRHQFGSLEETFRAALFQLTSLMSTTGYVTVDYNAWPMFSKLLLIFAMIMGSCAGSTSGGIKVSRIVLLFKEIKITIKKLIHPRLVDIVTMDKKKVELSVRNGTLMYIILYCLVFVVSVILISFNNFDFETTITSVLATLSNTGPGLNLAGPIENFAKFSNFSKIIFTLNMLIGRLEIIPVVFLFTPSIYLKYDKNK